MSRLFRIILILMVIVSLWGTVRIQTRVADQARKIQELSVRVKQEFGRVTDRSYQVDQHLLRHKDRIDDLTQMPDLAILDSCGIITDGNRGGSCVAIGPNLILTAKHCKRDAEVWVEIGGVEYTIIDDWASETRDIRFVQIDGLIPYVELGLMPELLDVVYLVGSPYSLDLQGTITKGIISYLDRDIWEWEDLIQADAEGAPGSSGGPLFNTSGQVIGICVAGAAPGGGVTLCESVASIQAALAEYNGFNK